MNVVQKYGGNCLDSMSKIRTAAKFTAANWKSGDGLVIVTSAMGQTAVELVNVAKDAGETISRQALDSLLSTGAQKVAAILAIALEDAGVPAVSLTEGLFTNTKDEYNQEFRQLNTLQLEQYLAEGKVVVVSGFQGLEQYADISDLGRGGSDATAVAIAAQLGWDCEIYTDSEGLYTTDPALYPKARKIAKVTHEEMMELSFLGRSLLEARSVEIAKKYDVNLFVGKAFENDKNRGTYIMNNDTMYLQDTPITGISIAENCTIFSLSNMDNDGVLVAKLFQVLADLNINVDMISKQFTADGKCTVAFSCTDKQAEALDKALAENEALQGIAVVHQPNLVMLSLVGVGMASATGVASKVFSVLATENIPYYQITTSEISISLTVKLEDKVKALIALSEAFGL
ncbi:MAG: aspartate kinase [Clostridiales bacterium]|nr:aspartate kinase [Clostridiales bacterium]